MYKTILLLTGALFMTAAPARVNAQNFDTSGTASLSGPYLFRYVNFFNDALGDLTESCSLTGVMTFDGAGNYTLSNTHLFDSAGAGTGSCASLGGGTYGVQSNGMAQLDNPLYPATLFGAFTKPVITASSTDDYYFDMFIAVQAPSAAVSNSSLSGAFTVGMLDFLDASNSLARQGYFTMNADGNGNIAAFTVTGSAANFSTPDVSQNVSGSIYALSGTTGGTWTLPGVNADPNLIVSGPKVLYVSADGNYVLGGATDGSDMIFGFRTPSGASSSGLLYGTYFTAGMDADLYNTPYFIDGFYGSISTNGNSNLIWHERFDDVADEIVYDNTFNTPVTLGSDGSYYDGTYTYLAGATGTNCGGCLQAVMLVGSGLQFSLNIGILSPPFTSAAGPWINPIGITNAANFTPITNAYAPGELVDLYGNYPVSFDEAGVLPIPKDLDGVKVFVNGEEAPVLLISPDHISAWIPYDISTVDNPVYFATFQVQVNGTMSNSVTVYTDLTAPGLYTLPETGLGEAAILHTNYTRVTDASPAKPGETVLLFMNGLGSVTPSVDDGAAGPSNPLSYSDEYPAELSVFLDDGVNSPAHTNMTFAGLAPDYAGLYQVNFTLPTSGLANGDVYIAFNTSEALSEMATIAVSGFPQSNARTVVHRSAMARSHAVAARSSHGRGVKSHRRALPDRPGRKPA